MSAENDCLLSTVYFSSRSARALCAYPSPSELRGKWEEGREGWHVAHARGDKPRNIAHEGKKSADVARKSAHRPIFRNHYTQSTLRPFFG